MSNELTKKEIRKVVLIYLAVVVIVNAIGAFLPAEFYLPASDFQSIRIWNDYVKNGENKLVLLYLLNYLITISICIIYIHPRNKENLKARFINLPFRYAGIGCIGWLSYFVIEVIYLNNVKEKLGIHITSIILSDLIYSVFMAFFCFTVVYYLLETNHREYYLPRFFPEGKLNTYHFTRKATLVLKIRNFYISVSICPILYVLFQYISNAGLNNLIIPVQTYIVLCIFFVFDVSLLILTIRYLKIPLEKLTEGARKIESGDYETKIDFVSSDDFGELTDAFNDMTTAIHKKDNKLALIQDSIIKGMALMVESRDINTGGHINRTSDCVKVFASKLMEHPDYSHIKPEFFEKVIKAAPMHDLGKIAVDDAVLRKPGKFTPEEYEMMKTHSAAGAKIVAQVIREVEDEEFKQIAINVAHYHHEKWNGEGYPSGLKEEDIPFEARIMALADVFDALVSKRCYKDSFTYDKAFSIIEESLGSHFDPFLGIQFLNCRQELEKLYQSYSED